jgi:hypothetical protein
MTTSSLTRARTRFPASLLVAVGLAVGFGVAQGTGNRPLGGLVFAAAGVAAGWLVQRRRGWRVTAGLGALYLGAFVLAHVLSIGLDWPAWGAVSLVTIAASGVTYWAADRA